MKKLPAQNDKLSRRRITRRRILYFQFTYEITYVCSTYARRSIKLLSVAAAFAIVELLHGIELAALASNFHGRTNQSSNYAILKFDFHDDNHGVLDYILASVISKLGGEPPPGVW